MQASIQIRPTIIPAYLAVVTLTAVEAALAQSDARARHEMVCAYLKKTAAGISSQCLSDVRDMADWKGKRPLLRQHLMDMVGLEPLPERPPLYLPPIRPSSGERFGKGTSPNTDSESLRRSGRLRFRATKHR